MWDYKKGLPPLEKPVLQPYIIFKSYEDIYSTDIDGFPYFVVVSGELEKTDKFTIAGQKGLYTLKGYDNDKKTIMTKLDKTLDISERQTSDVKEHYLAWGMKTEADKVKTNYRWGIVEFNIEGRLNKNQIIQCNGFIMKITALEKNDNGIIDIYGEHIHHNILIPIYPFVHQNEIIEWYYNMQDVWLRQVKEIK